VTRLGGAIFGARLTNGADVWALSNNHVVDDVLAAMSAQAGATLTIDGE
jgi:hypothetical protein